MRTVLILAVLCFCFYNVAAFADSPSARSNGPAMTMMGLDDDTTDMGAVGDIVKAINRLDAWIQKNLW